MASNVDRRRRPRRKRIGTGYLSSDRDVSDFRPPPPGPGPGVKRSDAERDKK